MSGGILVSFSTETALCHCAETGCAPRKSGGLRTYTPKAVEGEAAKLANCR